jgi:hypothetical protein
MNTSVTDDIFVAAIFAAICSEFSALAPCCIYLILYASVKYKYDSIYSTLDIPVNCVRAFNISADII